MDIYGKKMSKKTVLIELDNFLIKSKTEETLIKGVQGTAIVIDFTTIALIVWNILLDNSLKMIWKMFDHV